MTHARCLRYPPNSSSAPIPDRITLTPRAARRLAHEQRVDRGRITDRLIEDVDDPRQHADDVRRDLDLVQRDPVAGRDLPGVHGVVRHGFQPLILAAERDGVRVDPGVVPVRQHGDDARVQAAAEKAGHRHVGDQVGGDGFLDHRAPGRPAARPPPRPPRRRSASSAGSSSSRPGGTGPRSRRAAFPPPRWRSAARAASSRASTRPGHPARSAARSRSPPPGPSARRRRPPPRSAAGSTAA